MELRSRARGPPRPKDGARDTTLAPGSRPLQPEPARIPVNLRYLFFLLLAFRILNALLTRTFFQPDEHYQTTEIAHRLVFGYGFKSWEWSPSPSSSSSHLSPALQNLLNGPVRSILHPLLFVPGYALLKLTGLDQTYLLILFPRLQQAFFAAIGDLYTFRLAHRICGSQVAWFALLVGLSNLYGLYTATRTFSNSTEAAMTVAALFYWPFVTFSSGQFDVFSFAKEEERTKLLELRKTGSQASKEGTRDGSDEELKRVSRSIYDRMTRKSLMIAAFACLLRPTNGVLWIFLVSELFVRQLQHKADKKLDAQQRATSSTRKIDSEIRSLVESFVFVGVTALTLALAIDSIYDYFANQRGRFERKLPALSLVSFLHKNVVANLSIFYGANSWHWYITQGVPVLCTVWLPATLFGLITALQHNGDVGLGGKATRSLAKLVCVTVGVYSLLGHKEFRFLQPLLPALTVLAASGLDASYGGDGRRKSQWQEQKRGPLKSLWRTLNLLPLWLRLILLTLQPVAAIYLNTMHAVAQEQVPYELGRIYRSQQTNLTAVDAEMEFGPGFGRIHKFGFLMPCHSTPWATHLHDKELVERSWFIQCPPPPATSSMTPEQKAVKYWDQSDFFYHDPIRYLVDRFPYNVDTTYPPPPAHALDEEQRVSVWDEGWRHSWPSHLVVFEALLKEGTRKMGHTRTLKNVLSLKGYREVGRWWNSPKHEDARREGDIVVLAYKGPKSGPRHM